MILSVPCYSYSYGVMYFTLYVQGMGVWVQKCTDYTVYQNEEILYYLILKRDPASYQIEELFLPETKEERKLELIIYYFFFQVFCQKIYPSMVC